MENFRLRVTVDLEGRGFVPKVGYLDLRGKTLAEGQKMLRDSVARFFPKLGFGVTLVEPRTFLVQVVDDVARPGSYPARAIERVATLITRAGGFGPNASRRRIEVKRRDGTVLTADLLLYAITGDVKHNPYVLDGDAIRVPFQSLVASISGAVNRPGRYELVGHLRPGRAGRAGRRPHSRRHHRAAGAGGAARPRGEAHAPLLRLRRRVEGSPPSPWSARTACGSRPSSSCSSR